MFDQGLQLIETSQLRSMPLAVQTQCLIACCLLLSSPMKICHISMFPLTCKLQFVFIIAPTWLRRLSLFSECSETSNCLHELNGREYLSDHLFVK